MEKHEHDSSGSFLTLETVAQSYSVEVAWLRRVYELGLLGSCRTRGASVTVPIANLDVVAKVIQLHFHYGVELDQVEVLLVRESDA